MRAGLIAALMLAGCSTTGSGQLGSGEWHAVNINGVPTVNGPVTLRLAEGRVSGNTGCNSYSGTYELSSSQRIDFGPVTSTRAACVEEAAMEQERRFLSILENATGYNFYGDGDLSLIAADGRAVRLERNN